MKRDAVRAWLALAGFSLLLFAATASTYSALGVVLPAMVGELGWSWTEAGFGFTLLGACTGGSSFLPLILIRRFGVHATLLAGTALMTVGLLCLAITHGAALYFFGCALMGVAYQMMALIPGAHVLSALFKRRAFALGLYFTLGGLGGVAGPWLVRLSDQVFAGDWRGFWYATAATALGVGLLCTLLIGGRDWMVRRTEAVDAAVAAEPEARLHRSPTDWTLGEALRTPQFYVLWFAYFGHLLVGVTVASLSVAHLTEIGVAASVAGAMLSFEALVQTAGRAIGGTLGDRLDPKHLLTFGLGSLVIGSGVLSVANTYPLMLTYAVFTGLGFGLTVLSVTVLLLNYFGRRNNLEIFSVTCLSGAVSALGPVIGGAMRDHLGGFAPTFQLFAVLIFLVFLAALFMRPPSRSKAGGAAASLPGRLANDAA